MNYSMTATIWQNRYTKIAVSINPGRDSPEYVKKTTRQFGRGESYTTLVFSPKTYLKIYAGVALAIPGAQIGRASVPLNLFRVFASTLAKVYEETRSNKSMYVKDEHGVMCCDRAVAESVAKSFSVYDDKILVIPGIVDASDRTRERGLLFFNKEGQLGAAALYEVRDLIEALDALNPAALTMTMTLLEQGFRMEERLDAIDMKLNDLLEAVRGSSSKPVSGLPGTARSWNNGG